MTKYLLLQIAISKNKYTQYWTPQSSKLRLGFCTAGLDDKLLLSVFGRQNFADHSFYAFE